MIKYLQGLRCYDSDLVTIIQLKGMQENTLLAKCFDFQYETSEADPGKAISCPSKIEETIIHRGGQVVKGLVANLFEIQRITGVNNYCIAEVDTFCIPWHPKFGKSHKNHYVLVGGFQDGGVVVYDTMCAKASKFLTYAEFGNAMMSFDVWDFSKYVEEDIKIYPRKEQLKDMLRWRERMQEEDFFEGLRHLEIDSYDVPLYRNLWEIAYGRSLYGLYYTEKAYLKNEFKASSDLWIKIRQQTVWEYMQKTYNREKVLKAIDAAIDFDKNLIQKIYERNSI